MHSLKADVLVCGGGCAGLAAGPAAARGGAKTVLVERAGFAGGIITNVGLPYFDGLVDKHTNTIVLGGIPIRLAADASDPDELTQAEMQGRRDVWLMFERWKKEVPGFEDAYLISSGPYIGIRETRRIVGQYVLTEDDLVAERTFADGVATGCWYLDLHPQEATPGGAEKTLGHQPGPYDIPYRSLLAQKIANLLVAGRCHSATQLAASSTRVTATAMAMAMGQAAGVAAAVAVERKTTPAELSGALVRQTLHQQHAGPYLRP